MDKKNYVIDTNIILKNPYFLNELQGTIVIPSIVLQEIDNFKKDNEVGKNARIFARILDEAHKNNYVYNNCNIYISFREPNINIIKNLGGENPDNLIIETAKFFTDLNKNTTLLSHDILMRTKSRMIGVRASELTSEPITNITEIIYPGYYELESDANYLDLLYSNKYLDITDELKCDLYPNMFIKIKENGRVGIGKVNFDCSKLELVNPDIKPIWGISPKNLEQRMALQLLLDPEIPLVTMTGKSGTGKTLLSIASALVLGEENFYDKIILTKPVIPMGKDIGYLPGSKEEKMMPWLQSYFDNLEFLFNGYELDLDQLKIQIDALTYIRGRSLPRQFIIVDEVQNLSKHEVKSIITRAGEGAKIILLGDIKQIDTPHLDSINNGLVYTINKFKNSPLAGHISLGKGVRSKLAEEAADIL